MTSRWVIVVVAALVVVGGIGAAVVFSGDDDRQEDPVAFCRHAERLVAAGEAADTEVFVDELVALARYAPVEIHEEVDHMADIMVKAMADVPARAPEDQIGDLFTSALADYWQPESNEVGYRLEIYLDQECDAALPAPELPTDW